MITRTVETQLRPTIKYCRENSKSFPMIISWKTNKYTDRMSLGRTLDLTALINKPDGYLKGSLSDTEGCGLLRIQYYRAPGIKFREGYL